MSLEPVTLGESAFGETTEEPVEFDLEVDSSSSTGTKYDT